MNSPDPFSHQPLVVVDPSYPVPVSFKFAIGGYTGPSHELNLVSPGELEYKFAPNEYRWESPIILKPTPAHWEEFWQAMDAVNFWRWKAEYRRNVCDGTHWSVFVVIAGKSQRSTGSNAYPANLFTQYVKGGTFDLFLQAIHKLTGKPNIR